jgi:hypothetical protein
MISSGSANFFELPIVIPAISQGEGSLPSADSWELNGVDFHRMFWAFDGRGSLRLGAVEIKAGCCDTKSLNVGVGDLEVGSICQIS